MEQYNNIRKNDVIGMIKNLLSYFEKKNSVDSDAVEEIVRLLIRNDVGPKTSRALVESITDSKYKPIDRLKKNIVELLRSIDRKLSLPNEGVSTVLIVGANGVGKTTTTSKLAIHLKKNKQVMIVGADAFRAAAREQLINLLKPFGINVFTSFKHSDPSAIVYEALKKASNCDTNLLVVDTAGRLHTNIGLMAELKKIKRTVQNVSADNDPITILVLDGTSGRNGIRQVTEFNKELEIDGLIITKLDGSAKGGFILEIAQTIKKPIYFIGNGEKITDLKPFDAEVFAEGFLKGSFE